MRKKKNKNIMDRPKKYRDIIVEQLKDHLKVVKENKAIDRI